MKKYNFYAGPAILPQEVLLEASEAVKDFNGMGLSILEISHRSKEIVSVFEEATNLIYKLLEIDREKYAVLFLTGGASSQFFMTAMNILGPNETAGYVDTGSWSTKAIKEAKLYGNIEVLASSKDKNFTYIPKGYDIPSNLKYLHLTSNNTIFGTQFKEWPESNVPFIGDMSSDIFSKQIPVEKFDLIYAGAQKNLGPAGVTLVIIKRDIVGKVDRKLTSMLNYNTHLTKDSMFNTPPVYPTFVSMLTLRWLDRNGGIQAVEKRNEEKAVLLYNEIDRNTLFHGTTAIEDRSLMNVCFLLNKTELENTFLNMCTEAGCVGVKGHRSVGGFRASIYNAMEKEGVETLVSVMQDLEKKYG
jgi:phosphoserine aminotransferase